MSPVNLKKTLLMCYSVILTVAAGCSTPNNESGFNPDTGKHLGSWYVGHRTAYLTTCNQCADCHGADLRGGISKVSCFSAGFNGLTCHASGPAGHPLPWANPDLHGPQAKRDPGACLSGFSYCQTCHGNNFAGGTGTNPPPSCLKTAVCHGASVSAPHSPAPWTGARTHTNTDPGNATVCGLCHLGFGQVVITPYTPLPPGVVPGCFNNTLCHGQQGG